MLLQRSLAWAFPLRVHPKVESPGCPCQRERLGKSCSTGSCSGAAPHTAAGQGLVTPWAATVPQAAGALPQAPPPPPRVFEWRVLCGEGSTRPLAGSVTFPCPSGDPLGEPPSAGYSRTEPPQAGVIGAGHCRVPAVTASLPQAPGGAG